MATLPAAHSAVGFVHLRRGELAEALLPLTRAVEVGEAAEVRNWESQSVGLLGLQHALSGHSAEGVALLARATGLAEERGEKFTLAILETWLGEAYLAAGDLERASSYAEASLEMARTQPQRGTEAWAWHPIGEIAAATDPPDFGEAETAYREALARASNLRMRPLVAHCYLGLGKVYRRTGDDPMAREHLTAATTMYREMGMGFWLERAEAAIGRD